MAIQRVKTPAKMFTSDLESLEDITIRTMDRIDRIVGSSLGPGGRPTLIESDLPGIANKNTKDGVSIFRALGSANAYEHLIIEQTRDVAVRTVNEAGDGTTTATIIAASLIKNIFRFCRSNPKYSPQKITREIDKIAKDYIIPTIEKSSITVNTKNQALLGKVANISTNGDLDMSKAVIQAFELVGYGASSHVTIQELSGPTGYGVELIEGFPINKGYEESIGKFHTAFINDQGHKRCILDKPLFILFDGKITDMVQIQQVLGNIGQEYVSGNSDFANVVVIAHSFSDQVLTNLAFNFANTNTINVVPLTTPIGQMINYQLDFLMDVAAFTGATIFDMNNPLSNAGATGFEDFGANMDKIEIYRFRTTIVGDPDQTNIEVRASDIQTTLEQSSSKIEKIILEERLGKLTSGIARLKIFGASNGELKEKADRAEDAVCAVRATIKRGCLPGGGRMLLDLATHLLVNSKSDAIKAVLVPALYAPFYRLLDNSGYNDKEIEKIISTMVKDPKKVYDVANGKFGTASKLGIFDATLAVEQAILSAISISGVMGTLGGLIAFPRNNALEMNEYKEEMNFKRTLANADNFVNEANLRG